MAGHPPQDPARRGLGGDHRHGPGLSHHSLSAVALSGAGPVPQGKEDYLLFLDRLSPQKGPDLAIQAALRTGHRLIMAGKMVDSDKKFLETKIIPYIDGDRIIYKGELGFNEKVPLLKNAKALLHPHRFFEAFGNTLIESMACGTPVITCPHGAINEVVTDKKTGFIINDISDMAKAIMKIGEIKNQDCRKLVENKFTYGRMAEGYEKIYEKIISGKNR